MTKRAIDPLDWSTIVESVSSGRCVAFLGAGVNVSVDGSYQGLPLGGKVSESLVGRLFGKQDATLDDLISVVPDPEIRAILEENYSDLTKLRAHDLARVAMHIEARPGGRSRLLDLLAQILPDEQRSPSPLLATLAKLPFRLIVTTNYDRLMERAFEDQTGVAPVVVVQPTKGFPPKQQREWEHRLAPLVPDEPCPRDDGLPLILYKIHGTFGDDESGLVISEEDYITFLTVAGPESRRGMPRLIRQMIVDSNLLFLGYGLEDWNFRALYKGLIESLPDSKKRMSFALQKNPSEFWADFWAKPPKNVTIYDVDLYRFADELSKRVSVNGG
jgi:hypothetical protein